MLLYAFLGLIFILFGLSIHVFKMYSLIKHYRRMPVEKKAHVDIEGMTRFMGIVFYFDGILFLIAALLMALSIKVNLIAISVVIGVSLLFMAIYSMRFDGNLYDENHKLRKGMLMQMLLPILSSVTVVIVVGILILVNFQPVKVVLNENAMEIKGMYGGSYTYENMSHLKYLEVLPEITARTNGAAIGTRLTGHFKTKDMGSVKLFVNTNDKGYIYFEYEDKKVIFNQPIETLKETYTFLMEHVNP
ncbi:MAG: hypothetical protein BGO41_03205 [Clostridiales bacterium 38-18]|nr:MAG: hypothetical protein BGO41_03205 [Clostridiales bacterium 38-18]